MSIPEEGGYELKELSDQNRIVLYLYQYNSLGLGKSFFRNDKKLAGRGFLGICKRGSSDGY